MQSMVLDKTVSPGRNGEQPPDDARISLVLPQLDTNGSVGPPPGDRMTLNLMTRRLALGLVCLVASGVFVCLTAVREAGWLQTLELAHYDFATKAMAEPVL